MVSVDASGGVPPVVYVPCESPTPEGGDLTIDFRQGRDGQVVLLVYSALDRLVRCSGEQQAWVVMPTARLDSVAQHMPIDMIVFDVEVPQEHRRVAGDAP